MFNVLVVDDNEEIRKIVIDRLERHFKGIDCSEARSGKHAEQLILTNSNYHFIVSDINMPDGDGYYLLKMIEETNQKTFFIFLTFNFNSGEEKSIPTSYSGFLGVVNKFQMDELFSKIETAFKLFSV